MDQYFYTNDFDCICRLSTFCGKNITLESGTIAVRNKTQHNNALVFSALPLAVDELFEVSIEKWAGQWAGCIAVGITVAVPNEKTQLPSTVAGIKEDTWYVSGKCGLLKCIVIKVCLFC